MLKRFHHRYGSEVGEALSTNKRNMLTTSQQAKAMLQQLAAKYASAAVYLYGSRVHNKLKDGNVHIAIMGNTKAINSKAL